MFDTEEWRPVVGREDLYEVSNHGRVRRKARVSKGRVYPARMLKQSISNGYPFVGMKDKQGRQMSPRIHALVAAAFLGPRPEGKVVNHIDFDKTNNHVSNLEYVTHRENIQHSARHARLSGTLTLEQVQAIRSLVARDPAIDLDYVARRMGVPVSTLCGVVEARTYIHVPNKDGSLPTPLMYTHRKTLCVEDIEDFMALGFSVPQISKYYGLEYSTPYQMLRRAGIWQDNGRSHPGTGRRMANAKREEGLTES